MYEKTNIFTEAFTFLTKWGSVILSIGIGVLAKVSTEVLLKRKLSMMQWLGIMGVSVFGGYLMATWCQTSGWQEQGYYLVPLATLFSEKITIYITTNYRDILSRLLDLFIRRNENK